jgi:hypothetical protein
MSAGIWNVTVEQGTTFDPVLTWKDSYGHLVNVSGFTIEMQIRDSATSPTLLADLTPYITVGGQDGAFTFNVPASITATWSWTKGVYDIKVTAPGGDTKRLLEGKITVDPAVSR